MFSIGFSEIILVIIVAALVLKPEQMIEALKMWRQFRLDWRNWRAQFDAEQLKFEKEHDLAVRTARAAQSSDVSDLLESNKKDE